MNKITDVIKVLDFLENRVTSKFGTFIPNVKSLDNVKFYWKKDGSEINIKNLKLIPNGCVSFNKTWCTGDIYIEIEEN
jgi:hypothetical protein